jgi:hypothetical protein
LGLVAPLVSKNKSNRRKFMFSLFRLDSRPLALFLALAVAAPTLFAQESDHINGPDKNHDPTGAWLIRNDAEGSGFILTVFHKGGTLTGDFQGENAFDPSAVHPPKPPFNVQETPESGVWQKTGWNTFAVTFLTIESQVDPPDATLYQFDKIQFVGFLYDSGNRMETTAATITNFDKNGAIIGAPFLVPTKAHGVRVPLEVLPFTSTTLSIPTSHH